MEHPCPGKAALDEACFITEEKKTAKEVFEYTGNKRPQPLIERKIRDLCMRTL